MSPKTYKPSQQTKAHILQQAVDLFNEHGTAAVSMNALAEACGISAGNLQYHYRNKEEVVRAIYNELMYVDWEKIYAGMDESFNVQNLQEILRKNFGLTWKYRFFYREYAALLRNDEQLNQRFREIQEQRIAEQEALIKLLAGKGGVRTRPNPKEIRNMALISWVLGNTWLSYIESTGRKIDQTALDEAVEMMFLYYKPYLPK